MAEKNPSRIERLLLPRLSSMDGEIKVINSEIKRVNRKLESLDDRPNTGINALSEKFHVIRDIERLKVDVAELEQGQR